MRRVRDLLGPIDLAGPDAVPPGVEAFKRVRWVRCVACLQRYRVLVSRQRRLRKQRSRCCQATLRAISAKPRRLL